MYIDVHRAASLLLDPSESTVPRNTPRKEEREREKERERERESEKAHELTGIQMKEVPG